MAGVLRPILLGVSAVCAGARVRRIHRHAQLHLFWLGLLGKQILRAMRVQMALAGEQAHDARV
jgi:hypothetical protein